MSVTFRERRKGTLSVDNGIPMSGVATHGATALDTDGYLWIGNDTSYSTWAAQVFLLLFAVSYGMI